MKLESEIKLFVSGVQYTVKVNEVPPETTLNSYLRDKLGLTATKKMCLEGGCGTCIVAVEEEDEDGRTKVLAVNSCLVSIFSCHGWKIHTNEGIGNPLIGYHSIQKLLAKNNGSQCGFCSSGMVMNMYALQQSGPKTQNEIEQSFGGNLCRCTGYRPILTAFKKLAVDAEDKLEIGDLEDLKPCSRDLKCQNRCSKPCEKTSLYYDLGGSKWMKVYNLADLLQILNTSGKKTYRLVAGNTARGVYYLTSIPDIYIDITGVNELITYSAQGDSLVIGGNFTLTDSILLFRNIAKSNTKFIYLDKLADHIEMVAHVPVRNIGTIAGNLMTKYYHNEFPSDIFLILETVNATVVIVDFEENETRVTPQNFLKVDMNKKVIREIILPAYDQTYYYTSYKIMKRAQNAHAMLNAGFLFQLTSQGCVKSARITYGLINPTFVHASQTEAVLQSKILFDNQVLQLAFQSLSRELNPDVQEPEPSPTFRKQLAINLFYKYVLSIAPSSIVSALNKSGGSLLTRPVSSGIQEIFSKAELYPLTEPIIKLEALAQTSGQAKFLIDIPDLPGQLHGVLVKAQATPGSIITTIDASEALASSEVVAFYSAQDIPGFNSIGVDKLGQKVVEELFCSKTVQYYSQPVGVIVAMSHEAALQASSLVNIKTTSPTSKPFRTIRDVLAASKTDRIIHQTSFVRERKGTDVQNVIKGQTYLGSQYHFHMETQICLVQPTEDGLIVHAGTQWMDHTQGVISQVLKMPAHKVSIFIKRLGGGFGGKITRNAYLAGAAALAATKLNRPVRIWMDFIDNMEIIGKRFPLLSDYEVGVNASGVIQYLNAKLYTDVGMGGNEPVDPFLSQQFRNCYLNDTWAFDTYFVKTDSYPYSYMRGPGSVEGISSIETILDHIAQTLKLDPLSVRLANMDKTNNPILVQFMDDLKNNDDIDKRKADISAYNKANRWKKKALSIVPMRFEIHIFASYTTLVSIYHLDGSVAVSHAGVEMGQGINTKVAQVCAYKFGIPLEKVSVKPNYNVIAPNSFCTGGSITSEAVVHALLQACDLLLERIKPYREKYPDASWADLIQLCYQANVNLSTNGLSCKEDILYRWFLGIQSIPVGIWDYLLINYHWFSGMDPKIQNYSVFGLCALELEVDILTGKHEISRVDILEDAGQSMSPLIDVGQLEGAFVIGIGYHSLEELITDSSGKLLTSRTWNYKIPGAKDIPVNFRVRFSNSTPNMVGVLKSKAISEPPTCLSISLPLALRQALASARSDASVSASTWYPIDGPSTVENTLLNTLNNYTQYTL